MVTITTQMDDVITYDIVDTDDVKKTLRMMVIDIITTIDHDAIILDNNYPCVGNVGEYILCWGNNTVSVYTTVVVETQGWFFNNSTYESKLVCTVCLQPAIVATSVATPTDNISTTDIATTDITLTDISTTDIATADIATADSITLTDSIAPTDSIALVDNTSSNTSLPPKVFPRRNKIKDEIKEELRAEMLLTSRATLSQSNIDKIASSIYYDKYDEVIEHLQRRINELEDRLPVNYQVQTVVEEYDLTYTPPGATQPTTPSTTQLTTQLTTQPTLDWFDNDTSAITSHASNIMSYDQLIHAVKSFDRNTLRCVRKPYEL
jgi:hypothetical protein